MLLKQMHQVVKSGYFEFNARTYQRFTLHSLDNLYSFAEDSLIVTGAACVLDYTAAKFAFQSAYSVRLGPYRRNAEKYNDNSLIESDQAASFFAAQSNAFPWNKQKTILFWRAHTAHSSTALFSVVLKYRIPGILLDFMQNKREPYLALMETKHRFNHKLESTPELYFCSPYFMVSAGGRYNFYDGANFPVKYGSLVFQEAPWTYDITSRSSSALMFPFPDSNLNLQRDLIRFKGTHWKENNLAVYKNFIYGYFRSDTLHPVDWPQEIPYSWNKKQRASFSRGRFDFKVFDLSHRGIHVVLTRLRPEIPEWNNRHQKYARGTVEIIDASLEPDPANIVDHIHRTALKTKNICIYTLYSGERIHLAKQEIPLMRVTSLHRNSLAENNTLAEADGKGNMFITNPYSGDSLSIQFELWWYPRRLISRGADISTP
jgi:hypothetical protein